MGASFRTFYTWLTCSNHSTCKVGKKLDPIYLQIDYRGLQLKLRDEKLNKTILFHFQETYGRKVI